MDKDFKKKFHKSFSDDNQYKIVFNMSDYLKDEESRVKKVIQRFKSISQEIFHDSDIWVALVIWNQSIETAKDLKACGFKIEDVTSVFKGNINDNIFNFEDYEDSEIIYLYYDKFDFAKLKPLVRAIAGFELAVKPSASITAYFLNFQKDRDVLLNLYDDRGMELFFASGYP